MAAHARRSLAGALCGHLKVVKIRKATLQDRVAICEVHVSAARMLGCTHYGPQEIEAWVAHLTPDLYSEAIAAQEFLVAEEAGGVVGFGQLNQNSGVIEAVYVSPAHAGRGIGTALLAALESAARTTGLRVLRLDASLNSVEFYTRAGYHARGEGLHRTRGGRDVRCVHMQKDLAA